MKEENLNHDSITDPLNMSHDQNHSLTQDERIWLDPVRESSLRQMQVQFVFIERLANKAELLAKSKNRDPAMIRQSANSIKTTRITISELNTY